MAKPHVTKTLGPVHFEDLEPHRFEDLVREVIYDFRDWQSIEGTGRSGSDEGYDIRAFERVVTSDGESAEDEEYEPPHPMEGNAWMVQVKREKEIGPTALKRILQDVDPKYPPYGYILAAAANFSKKSYDLFRDELRARGVTEFYLWGKAELEDMLYLPKNDRMLFAFFGISLTTRRRSRTTELRSFVATKNKLFRALGGGVERVNDTVLIRDLNDTHYPFKHEYKDFEEFPRWREYQAFSYHPLGIWVHSREFFAYLNREASEWDFTRAVDLTHQNHGTEEDHEHFEKRRVVHGFWEFLPQRHQAHLIIDCLVEYADIALVDDKGDLLHRCPHVYVLYDSDRGPFRWCRYTLKVGEERIDFDDDEKFTRVSKFPNEFPEPIFGKVHTKPVVVSQHTLTELKKYRNVGVLFDPDGRYRSLKVRDVAPVQGLEEKTLIQVTHKFKSAVKSYADLSGASQHSSWLIQQQLGRAVSDDEEIDVLEFKQVNDFEL